MNRYRRMHHLRSESAQVIVLFGLMLPVLIGGVAIIVDGAIVVRQAAELRAVAASAARAGASAVSVDALNLTDDVTLNPFDTDQVRAAVDEVCFAYATNRDLDGLQCSGPVIGEPPTRGLAGAAWATFAVQETNRKHVVPLAVKVTATREVPLHFLRVLSGKATIELSQTQWATPVTGP